MKFTLPNKHLSTKHVNKDELKEGVEEEHEHTSNSALAKQIALDHLKDDKKYYTHLESMEEKYNAEKDHMKKEAFEQGFKKRASEYGVSQQLADNLIKIAVPRGIENTPTGTGPGNIADAVTQFERLRALVAPSKDTLKNYGLSNRGFQGGMKRIINKSQDNDKYNLSDIAPDPKMRGAVGAGLGGALGAYAGGHNGTIGQGIEGGLAGALLAGGGAYLHGKMERSNLLNTAKLLKQYGMLNPQTLRKAYPLLANDYRFK